MLQLSSPCRSSEFLVHVGRELLKKLSRPSLPKIPPACPFGRPEAPDKCWRPLIQYLLEDSQGPPLLRPLLSPLAPPSFPPASRPMAYLPVLCSCMFRWVFSKPSTFAVDRLKHLSRPPLLPLLLFSVQFRIFSCASSCVIFSLAGCSGP